MIAKLCQTPEELWLHLPLVHSGDSVYSALGSPRDLLFESGKGSTLYSWPLSSPPNSKGTKLGTVFPVKVFYH